MKAGDAAPDFELPDQEGRLVRLSDFAKQGKSVALFFYPRDGTPVCAAEACAFRDAYEDFAAAGVEVLGISGDGPDSHARFAARRRLPFRLLTDSDGAVRARYGVAATWGLLPGRVTFVIDPRGVIRLRFAAQFAARRHVEEALRALGLPPHA